MITLIQGKDAEKIYDAKNKLSAKYARKKTFYDSLDMDLLLGTFAPSSLFEQHEETILITVENMSNSPDFLYFLENNIENIRNSQKAHLLIIEEKPIKQLLTLLSENEIIKIASSQTRDFSIFGFVDTWLSGNKKASWVSYRKLISEGKSAEEIYNIMWWGLKNIHLAKYDLKGAQKTMKPFVLNKYSKYSAKFSEENLAQLTREMMRVWYERDLNSPLENRLEKILLGRTGK